MAVQSLLTTQSANGYEYQAVTLETVVLEKLVSNDPTELEKLVKAAKSPGFFYLDLNNDEKYLGSLQEIYDSADKYFDQPEDVKMVDFRKDQDSSQDRGYKLYPGEAETLEISREEVLKKLPAIPEGLKSSASVIESFIETSHKTTRILLAHLSFALNLPQLADFHHDDQTNDCGLKIEAVHMVEKLEDVPPSEHTDNGTITLLYCPEFTTEVRVPGTETWGFIVPKPGHAIVNVANSLQTLSNGELLSCLHRVGQPAPGAKKRFCVLYYLRPDTGRDLKSAA